MAWLHSLHHQPALDPSTLDELARRIRIVAGASMVAIVIGEPRELRRSYRSGENIAVHLWPKAEHLNMESHRGVREGQRLWYGMTFSEQARASGELFVAFSHPNLPDTLALEHARVMLTAGINHLLHVMSKITLEEQRAKLAATAEEQKQLITQLKTAQQQMLRSEKLAALGQLAAGVAHEINNPTAFVASNLESLGHHANLLLQFAEGVKAECSKSEPNPSFLLQEANKLDLSALRADVDDLLEECRDGLARIRRIVAELRVYSRFDEENWQNVDLNQCLDAALNIARPQIRSNARLETDFRPLPPVECLPGQIGQVLINLVINAYHATEGKQGLIRIGTEQMSDTEVAFTVEDNGSGMDPAIMDRIFEPFFTTKPTGRGTGLGLSISQSIVERHGGRIDVDEGSLGGCRFRVVLPITQKGH
jgi:signal transduction histidine kinase